MFYFLTNSENRIFPPYDNEYHINIQGILENPLFQANQIGKLLEMTILIKLYLF
jgi:hypothetical protein